MIDSLYDQAREGDIAIAGLYCDYLIQQEQTVINMMGAILKRLVGRGIPNDIWEAFQERRIPLLADLLRMLRAAIASIPQVFIFVGALDQCLPKYLPEILELLGDIIRECPGTRIFLTRRPHIRDRVQRYFPKAVVMPIIPKTEEVRNCLERRLDMDVDPDAMGNDLRAGIMRITPESVSDTTCVGTFMISTLPNDVYLPIIVLRFLLVAINIDAVLGEVTIRQRRNKLDELARGKGLGYAYTATLARVGARGGRRPSLGMTALMWVLFWETTEELCHALGVELGSLDLDLRDVLTLQKLLTCCLGHVVVE